MNEIANREGLIAEFRGRLERELPADILPWWKRAKDETNGGFYGRVENDGSFDPRFDKGIVMHARFLWSYSAAYLHSGDKTHLELADHAYRFVTGPLYDREHGGFYWQVSFDGKPVVDRKVIYGEAFAIYALSEYYRATKKVEALETAVRTFGLLEKVARDREFGGYAEACEPDWSAPVTSALSDVDIPCAKSMNTNLHVMEAFASLALALKEAKASGGISGFDAPTLFEEVKSALRDLVLVHVNRIRRPDGHFNLYFDRDWTSLRDITSFGHDIEGSWLIDEAALIAWDGEYPKELRTAALGMAAAILPVVEEFGPGLVNEKKGDHLDRDRIWWVQAECMVGFLNAAVLSHDDRYLSAARKVWDYIEEFIVDKTSGEWFWGRLADGSVMPGQPKGGLWKTSYHDARACMEAMKRLDALATTKERR
jgi:mannobiose 2-epimerase